MFSYAHAGYVCLLLIKWKVTVNFKQNSRIFVNYITKENNKIICYELTFFTLYTMYILIKKK